MSKNSVKRTGSLLSLLLLLPLLHNESQAAQLLEASKDGDTLIAKISAKEVSRIKLTNGRIKKFVSTPGELVLDKDEDAGQIFVRPASETKPVNAFLTDDRGVTYTLILQPVDVPSETIQIKTKVPQTESIRSELARAGTYDRAIKNMLLAMMQGTTIDGYEVESIGKPVPLWNEAYFLHNQTFRSGGLVGDKFKLVNRSPAEMRLSEQEFFRERTLAIVIEKMVLAPGESTLVYLIKAKAND